MREWAAKHRWESILIVVLMATIVVNVSLSPFYLGFGNFVNLFWLSIEKIIVVIVMTFVIINGEIDLSVASVMGFSAAVMATLYAGGEVPFAVAILIGTARRRHRRPAPGPGHHPVRAALAGGHPCRADRVPGAARVLLEDRSVGDFPEWFERIGQQTLVGPFPVALVLFFVGLALAWIILERSAFGRKVYVIGNSADVARFSGIEVDSVKLRLFVASGTVAGLAGILFAARVGAVQGTLGETYRAGHHHHGPTGRGEHLWRVRDPCSGWSWPCSPFSTSATASGWPTSTGSPRPGSSACLLIGSVLVPNLARRYRLRRPAAEC